MKVAFRKNSWNPISRLIMLFSWGPYCHCEFVFPTKPRTWFGAVLSGLRFTQDITGNPKKWDFVEIDWDEKKVWGFCKSREGRKYDIPGILSFIPGINWFIKQDPRWDWCSETIYDAGVEQGRLEPNILKVHPNKLYKLLNK